MKTPIEPSEIRAGDLIRIEFESSLAGDRALEYIANDSQHRMKKRLDKVLATERIYYLLDRPTPAVELPTEPTLGWLTWRTPSLNRDRVELAVWQKGDNGSDEDYLRPHDSVALLDEITAFTPATAVPTSALDELRRQAARTLNFQEHQTAARTFLAAVDEAAR